MTTPIVPKTFILKIECMEKEKNQAIILVLFVIKALMLLFS